MRALSERSASDHPVHTGLYRLCSAPHYGQELETPIHTVKGGYFGSTVTTLSSLGLPFSI